MDGDRASTSVVARAACILRTLGEQPSGMSLGQIARRSGLARSTVQRLIGALAAERLVATAGAGQITLGPELLRLSASARAQAPRRLRTLIRALAAELGETVDLSVVRQDQVVFLDQAPGSQRLQAVSQVGAAFPLHCCASGKAYLAQLSDQAVEALIGRDYPRCTARTLTTLPALLADLAAIRRTGVAVDNEEHTEGISALGVGVGGQGDTWFGISVPMPVQRFGDQMALVTERLRPLSAHA